MQTNCFLILSISSEQVFVQQVSLIGKRTGGSLLVLKSRLLPRDSFPLKTVSFFFPLPHVILRLPPPNSPSACSTCNVTGSLSPLFPVVPLSVWSRSLVLTDRSLQLCEFVWESVCMHVFVCVLWILTDRSWTLTAGLIISKPLALHWCIGLQR